MPLQHYVDRFLHVDFPDEARKETPRQEQRKEGKKRGRSFLSLIPAGIRLSRITVSHNSNRRKRERRKENERRDQSAQVRLDKLED